VSVKIRNLVVGEALPERLCTGYETGQCDPRWIWVAERDGKPVAILVTAPAHVVVILMRLVATENAEPLDVRALLVNAMAAIKERGYAGYVTWVDPTKESEKTLMEIIKTSGGGQWDRPQVACYGAA